MPMASNKRKVSSDEKEKPLPKKCLTDNRGEFSTPAACFTGDEDTGGIVIIVDDDVVENSSRKDEKIISSCDVPNSVNCCDIFMLSAKNYIIHYDYILFPYWLKSREGGGGRSAVTISYIIERSSDDERYIEMKEKLEELDKVLNCDTSKREDLLSLAYKLIDNPSKIFKRSKSSWKFFNALIEVLAMESIDENNNKKRGMANEEERENWEDNNEDVGDDNKNDEVSVGDGKRQDKKTNKYENAADESLYRRVFKSFLDMVVLDDLYSIHERPGTKKQMKIDFPLWNTQTAISGKPDILIRVANDIHKKYETLVLVECKKYCELEMRLKNIPISDDKKTLTHCKYCDKLKHILGETVGEVLAWFDTYDKTPCGITEATVAKQTVRYAICQIGFKIIFITVGVNSSNVQDKSHITIGGSTGMGLDIFMTRPYDLMKIDDRSKIADILFALMRYKYW